MIAFRHKAEPVTIQPGGRWKAKEAGGETYRDTPADELGRIVEEVNAGEPWRACVQRHYAGSKPWLCRIVTDPCRDLFFRQYPPRPGSLVLDIGAGWGQLALPLARTCTVAAVEPTPERLDFIAAAARQDGVSDRISFIEADFLALEFDTRFDLVCCIGVLEWVPKFRAGPAREVQLDFLSRIRGLLAPGGQLVIGIENRLGLKYILGVPDDHIGLPVIAVLEAEAARRHYLAATGKELRSFTYSHEEYHRLLAEAGFTGVKAYAAFPDYKLPELILPADETLESALAGPAAMPPEHNGADGSILSAAMQETLASHYRSLAKAGISRFFAPSYFLVAGS
ncbi:MAG: class I SAM-dependent methyltransferase [Pseudomonadota bacterium]